MNEYIEIDYLFDKATMIIKSNKMTEYTNYVECDGIWYKRSIVKLKHKPKEEDL